MENKKMTNGQLQRRIKNAIIHVDKTKETIDFFFSDKGIRLTVTDDYAIIETGFHKHVFSSYTNVGICRPWLYTKQVVEIANDIKNEIQTSDGYSYAMMLKVLSKDEDKSKYNICYVYDWYLFNLFVPLYEIGETELSAFLVYESYIHNIARNSVMLDQHNEDITNKGFIKRIFKGITDFTENLVESVIIKKKTDEEIVRENIEAIQEQEQEQVIEAQINESKD